LAHRINRQGPFSKRSGWGELTAAWLVRFTQAQAGSPQSNGWPIPKIIPKIILVTLVLMGILSGKEFISSRS